MKKFVNTAGKVNAIREVFSGSEKLNGKEIAQRLEQKGYRVRYRNLQMFIYHTMLHKHLRKDIINGINVYALA